MTYRTDRHYCPYDTFQGEYMYTNVSSWDKETGKTNKKGCYRYRNGQYMAHRDRDGISSVFNTRMQAINWVLTPTN
jgi:hypothetical protein